MLSKSDLQSHLQCSRKLWLEHHEPQWAAADDSSARRRKLDGEMIGAHARGQLADPLWPAGKDDKGEAAAEAWALLNAAPGRSAVEMPMAYGGLYARADALVWAADGFVLSETKASTFPLKADKVTPGKPHDEHLVDVAIQAWVMTQCGLPMKRAELNLLDSRWRYPGGEDFRGLFRPLDVTDAIDGLIAAVPEWLAAAEATLAGGKPETRRGKHCTTPYSCPFDGHCGTLEPEGEAHPLELLPDSGGKALAKRLREAKGYVSILQPEPDELTGPQAPLFLRMQAAHRSGQPVFEPGCAEVLNALPYPRYYFDFEGIDLPAPRWAGVRPFEQVPFQWSCHIERAPGVFEHAEFLDLTGEDPSEACIEKMIDAMDPAEGGPIFVYSETYERGVLRGLATRHDKHAGVLQAYMDRLHDLLPLVKNHFYHPQMRGSFSIKKVLPVVAADLDYDGLDGVQEGTGAQLAYLNAILTPALAPKERSILDGQLRTYCRQDTWAMVELVYFLAQAGRPQRPAGM